MPMEAGPDGPSLTTPYVSWTVQTSGGALVGGATVTLQGPRASNGSWGASVDVLDNTGQAGYSGPDLDPDPGEFAVHAINGTVLSTSSRYRIQQQAPPSSYVFTGNSGVWLSISAGGGNQNTPASGQWVNDTHSFGPITVAPVPTNALHCDAGWVYSISQTGQLRSVDNNSGGAVASVGNKASSVTSFNGLGIGRGGSPVYAYERSGTHTDIATIWQYDTSTGTWTSTSDQDPTGLGNALVAGAVDLATNQYMFGGFTHDGQEFHVYSYSPGQTPKFTYKGWIDTDVGAGGDNNGDMAFSSNGDLWVVRGSGTTTTVFSVTATNLGSANGGQIMASQGNSVTNTASGVNGVAFDSAGLGYLGNGTTVSSWNIPAWTSVDTAVTSGLSDSSDLASCSSPASITVQKVVQGRVNPSDQFTLGLSQSATQLGTATTTGSATGLQPQQVGPLPTGRVALNISESASGTTDFAKYGSVWSCAVDGVAIPGASGTGTSGTVTIPTSGQDVVCQFTNSPLVANVTINKQMQDSSGQNAQPRQGWTVGATATAPTGTVTSTSPSAATQPTDANGNAAWNVTFGSSSSAATVAVHEEQQTGYDFVSGSCTVTKLSGATTTTQLTGPGAQSLTGVGPGDQVNCTYTNKPSATKLTLVKQVTNSHDGTAQPTAWILTATGGVTTISGVTGTAAVTGVTVQPGTYTLAESGGPAGYVAGTWSCTGATATGSSVTLTQGANVTCTITNSDQPGSVTWTKTDNSGQALSGSQWTLTGPGAASGTTVTDCTQAPCSTAPFADQDPAVGQFTLSNLSWGDYTLVESKAPVGYVLDTTKHTFTVGTGAGQVGVPGPTSIGTFTNTQATVPVLPLTGGMSTDAFILIGGGSLAAAGLGGWWNRRSMRKSRD